MYINIFCRFQVDGEEKYLPEVQELIRPERNTLTVSYQDVESYNAQLSTIIQEEYYRWEHWWSQDNHVTNLFWDFADQEYNHNGFKPTDVESIVIRWGKISNKSLTKSSSLFILVHEKVLGT